MQEVNTIQKRTRAHGHMKTVKKTEVYENWERRIFY